MTEGERGNKNQKLDLLRLQFDLVRRQIQAFAYILAGSSTHYVGAFGPGRKHSLLPALAKNMPSAYFLNASRPLGGGLDNSLVLRNRLRTNFIL